MSADRADETDWDAEAATFDDEPDHGLRDPDVRAAWASLLTRLLPSVPSRVADLGCGTGSLSVMLAGSGHQVTGVDRSPEMVDRARRKAAQAALPVLLGVGDAAAPGLEPGSQDVVLARHLVWALPDPAVALRTWARLLAPGGRLVLVEGRWSTGSGLTAQELVALVDGVEDLSTPMVEPLADPAYWGGPVTDERYVLVADRLEDR